MSTTYRRIDTTDPRRYDKVKALTFPAAWLDDGVDLYGFILSSATMISGMAMVTRFAPIAYIGLIFGIANFAHEKQYQAKKESARSAAGPIMTLAFAILSIIMITMQKLTGSLPLHHQMIANANKATATAT